MREIKPLILTNILCSTATMAFMPLIAPIIRNLNLQEWHGGLSVTLGALLWVFFASFWGKKSDEIGRKNILIIGVLGIGISYLFLALFIDFALKNTPLFLVSLFALILARGAMSLFYSAITPASSALVADKVDKANRASFMAKLGISNGLGLILGPILGGILAIYGLQAPLYTFSILPFLAMLILYFSLEKDKISYKIANKKTKFFDKRLISVILATFLTMFAFMSINSILGFFVLDIFNLNDANAAKITGYLLSVIGVLFIVSQILVTKIKTISDKMYLMAGILFCAFGMFIFAFSQAIWLCIFSSAMFGIGMGLSTPAIMAITTNLVELGEQGNAAGIVSSAKGMGMIFGPLISTSLYGFSMILPFLLCGTLLIIYFLFAIRTIKKSEVT